MLFKKYIVIMSLVTMILLTGCKVYEDDQATIQTQQQRMEEVALYVDELENIYNDIENKDVREIIALILDEKTRGYLSKDIINTDELDQIVANIAFKPIISGKLDNDNMDILKIRHEDEEIYALYKAGVKDPLSGKDTSVSTIYMIYKVDERRVEVPSNIYFFKTSIVLPYTGEGMQFGFNQRINYYQYSNTAKIEE